MHTKIAISDTISDKGFNGTVVNRALLSLRGCSIKKYANSLFNMDIAV